VASALVKVVPLSLSLVYCLKTYYPNVNFAVVSLVVDNVYKNRDNLSHIHLEFDLIQEKRDAIVDPVIWLLLMGCLGLVT
jgi:hypothetical protein